MRFIIVMNLHLIHIDKNTIDISTGIQVERRTGQRWMEIDK